MAVNLLEENRPTFAWDAICASSDRYTRLEPIPSRSLLPVFAHWPTEPSMAGCIDTASDDLAAALSALQEPGDRLCYSEFRKELGL
jgi:hypothetical protein